MEAEATSLERTLDSEPPVDPTPGGRMEAGVTCRECGAGSPAGFRFCGACGAPFAHREGAPAFRDPLIGAVVADRYRILERRGSGGMGAVYKVQHVRIGKIAAMKLMHGDLVHDEAMVRRFNREARAVSRLTSPHTVSVFDYGRSAGLVYIVMEFLEGRDLADLLEQNGPLAPVRVATFLRQIAHSLAEAHSLGIVHRDLKPENLFVTKTAEGGEFIKVLDFGLAKLVEARDESLHETQTGSLLGTPYYMSPEQIEGKGVDARSDIYALGAVLFRLLTGQPPYRHQTAIGVLQRHLHDPVPRVSELRPELAPLDGVLQRAMSKLPAQRQSGVAEFAEQFSRVVRAMQSGEFGPVLEAGDARVAAVGGGEVGTREEFDRYERMLQVRRVGGRLFAVLLLAAVTWLGWWGVAGENFARRETEREPNGDFSTATRVFDDEPIRGFAGSDRGPAEADADNFVFRPRSSSPGMARVELQGVPGLPLRLTVSDASGREIADVVTDPRTLLAIVPNARIDQPALYMRVTQATRVGETVRVNLDTPYSVRVRTRPEYEGEESEPNGVSRDARLLGSGERVAAMIGWPGDTDRFQVPDEAVAAGTLRLSLTGVTGLNLAADVFDRAGTSVATVDGAGLAEGEEQTIDLSLSHLLAPFQVAVRAGPDEASELMYFMTLGPPPPSPPPRPERDRSGSGEDAPGTPGTVAPGPRLLEPARTRPESPD